MRWGTPISIRANKENVNPSEITNRYYNEFKYCFDKLGFSYDLYSRADDKYHKTEVHSGPFQPNPSVSFFYILDPNGLKIQFVENIK